MPLLATSVNTINIDNFPRAKNSCLFKCKTSELDKNSKLLMLPNNIKHFHTTPLYFSLPLELDYDQFVDVLNNKTGVVIDVRNPEELAKLGEIPGAINIPLGDLEAALSMRPKKLEQLFGITINERTPLVFSCMAGIRSKKAMAIAASAGYSQLSDFGGGWIDWDKNNQK